MLMSRVLAVLLLLAVVFGAMTGRMADVALAAVSGTQQAVELILSIVGTICLWSALMEVMNRSGLAAKVARALRPVIVLLFGKYGRDGQAAEAISQNMAANLLGLGSAATPAGLRAAKRLDELARRDGVPPDSVLLLIVINTASVQLLPTTVAAVRATYGSQNPYDILPAVWAASIISVAVGIFLAKTFKRVWRDK